MVRIGTLLALVAVIGVWVVSPGVSSADSHDDSPYYDQISASDSYYTLNVAEGSMTVRVEITIQSAGGELETVFFWAMPTAENVVISIDGIPQKTSFTPGDPATSRLSQVWAALPQRIVGAQRAQAVLTYDVAPHEAHLVRMEPGLMELAFTGQGIGSFVLLDLPVAADNYVDPGCLFASNQPAALTKAGFERYVCGEAALVALNFDDAKLINDCAALHDRCRQRFSIDPYSAYVQSVTDESKRGVLEADIQLGDRTVRLELLYFLADREWAERQFAVARQAFPLLEELFGFEYPFDSLIMRESHKVGELGFAGVAFPTKGELLLAAGSFADDEVTVHEMAHQWAGFNLTHPWLWEGQAQWATAKLAPQLGIVIYDRNWESFEFDDPLSTWFLSSNVTNPNYWYGKAGAFWASYEAALGPEGMARVLAATDDDPSLHPLDGRWFMDRGELESGVNLDALFLGSVWVDIIATPLVDQRRVAWDTVAPLRQRVESLEIEGLPSDIQSRLDAWLFGGVASLTTTAFEVLDARDAAMGLGASEGLPTVDPLTAFWSEWPVKDLLERVDTQREAILTIVASEAQLSDGFSDSPAWEGIAESRDAYSRGDFAQSIRLADDAVAEATRLFAEALVLAANLEIAEQSVAAAQARQEDFSADFFAIIGLLFTNPDGDLAAAEQALAEGDTVLAVEQARAALDAWDGARAGGMKLLIILTALVASLSIGGWFALHRLGREPQQPGIQNESAGHFLEESTSGVDWREWENKSKSRSSDS